MRRSVDLILPDTGPLITLAAADRLELLASFGRPVMIPDVIREEATAKPGSPGHDRLTAWFGNAGHNQYRIVDTPFIGVYNHLKTQPNHPNGTPAASGMGEATLLWVVANVERLHAPGTACLVLTEDGRAGDQMPDDVHVLSTRSWLNGLERLRVIESAQAVIDAVVEGGRSPSRYSRDQRGRDAAGRLDALWRGDVEGGPEPLRVEWAHDSAWRFFPARRDREFGYVLHPVDLATNEVLAAAGRSEPRDLVDLVDLSPRVPIGAAILAAVGRDPGMTPGVVIENIRRFSRHRPEDYLKVRSAEAIDAMKVIDTMRAALNDTLELADRMPAEALGRFYFERGKVVVPHPDRLGAYGVREATGGGIAPRVDPQPAREIAEKYVGRWKD